MPHYVFLKCFEILKSSGCCVFFLYLLGHVCGGGEFVGGGMLFTYCRIIDAFSVISSIKVHRGDLRNYYF